jgi:hypothetical protein
MNGCHNHTPYKDAFGSYGLDSKTGEITYFVVQNPNTKDCNYRNTELGKADKGFNGCKWRNK